MLQSNNSNAPSPESSETSKVPSSSPSEAQTTPGLNLFPKRGRPKKRVKKTKVYAKASDNLIVEEVKVDERGKIDTSLLTQSQIRLISSFRRAHGVVSVACREVSVSRDTFYRWISENRIFAELIERAKNENIDYVENKLWEKIERGDPWAIQMYLRANHPAYADKLQIGVKQLTPSWYDKLKGPKKLKAKTVGDKSRDMTNLEKAIDRGDEERTQELLNAVNEPM